MQWCGKWKWTLFLFPPKASYLDNNYCLAQVSKNWEKFKLYSIYNLSNDTWAPSSISHWTYTLTWILLSGIEISSNGGVIFKGFMCRERKLVGAFILLQDSEILSYLNYQDIELYNWTSIARLSGWKIAIIMFIIRKF